MKYDQEYINGLGAISRRSLRSKQGKTKTPPPAKRRSVSRDEDEEEQPEKKPKDVYFKKRKYPFETVDTVTESVKFIRRFVNLTRQKIELHKLTAFIRALQKAIVERLIRKSSPHAKDIAAIQESAIAHYRNARGKWVYVELDEKLRDKYYAIGRGEKVRGSVSILKRFVKLVDQPYGSSLKKTIENILESLAYQYKKEIIKKNDPYFVKVKEAELAMKKALRDHSPIRVTSSALNGIHGIIQYETVEPDFFDEGGTDLNGIENAEAVELSDEPNAVPASLTGEQLRNMQFDSVELNSYYTKLLGHPARNCFMVVYGPPWHGKSSFVVSLSKSFAENIGKVAYISPEQHGSLSQQVLVAGMDALNTPGLQFFRDLPAAGDLRQYACVVIDSGTAAGLTLDDATALHEMLARTALVVILQSTKDDDFRGEQGWRHMPDIVLKVKERHVHTEKNRYRLDPVSLPIPLPTTRQLPAPGQTVNPALNGIKKKAPQEIEITATFDAPLQWIAETILGLPGELNIGGKMKANAKAYEHAIRTSAKGEIAELGLNVTIQSLKFSHLDNVRYHEGTAFFDTRLRGSPDDLRKVAGDNGNSIFIYKWK